MGDANSKESLRAQRRVERARERSARATAKAEARVARDEARESSRKAREDARARKDAQRREEDEASGRKRRSWRNLSYTARMTIVFALVAAMTALVAFGVLSFVWQQHFDTYTRENIQRVADTAAQNIAERYAASDGEWSVSVLSSAEAVTRLSDGLGAQVVDEEGKIVYDGSRTMSSDTQLSLAPTNKTSVASAAITVDGESVGTIYVWVYGGDGLLTQSDQEFRDESYQAMLLASGVAVLLAIVFGALFSRGLVDPINRVSKAAKAFGEGDLKARTNLVGDDEIAKLGQTFDRMAEAVEKDRKLERRLTTDVAHELRTPLMAIQSTVEAMIDGVFEADEERLETVNSEVQRLSRLVDAILKLSRLENRSTPLKKQVVNVGELISGLIATHEAYVQDSGLTLSYSAEDDVYVYADPDLVRQAVANLISNAVRYTPEGGITVSVRKGSMMAQVAVADTGIGLSPEDAKMVFSRFWRAEAGRNRESGGLGIGLSVVKEIVEQHGGWVRVEGKTGEGATFTIYIPLYSEESVKSEHARGRRGKMSHNGKDEKPAGESAPAGDGS